MRFSHILCVAMLMLAQSVSARCPGSCCGPKNVELSMGYVAGVPLGEMGRNINMAHNVGLRGFYLLPCTKGRAAVGLDITSGTYAAFTRTQTFGMNGVETPVDVKYNSNLTTATGIMRQDIFRSKSFTVFAAAKAGMAKFASEIVLEDPNDPDGCEPLDRENLISEYTWVAGAQTGLSLDMNAFVRKLPAQIFLLQAYAGYLHGGNVDYINVRRATTDDHSGHTHSSPDGGRPLDVRFINLQTNIMHTHEVARVYTSPVQFMECGIMLVLKF